MFLILRSSILFVAAVIIYHMVLDRLRRGNTLFTMFCPSRHGPFIVSFDYIVRILSWQSLVSACHSVILLVMYLVDFKHRIIALLVITFCDLDSVLF